ncbi:MAG: class I SAM-dependent methyltransferase [Acidobacteria bacterium]|nr:class I SAM-dependent methyltransferase [Acidobacteriota bacterium]
MVFLAGCVLARREEEIRGRDVFEFGCGTGRNLAAMREWGARSAAGCDLSEGMLAVARARGGELRLSQCDMCARVPVGDSSAGFILFSLTLEHVPDLEAPLREAARMLQPGGRVAIIEIHPFLSHDGLAAHFHEGGEEVRMPTFPHTFSGYIDAFRRSGLRLAECREWRPSDLGTPLPLQGMRRGPDFPMAVEFTLERA